MTNFIQSRVAVRAHGHPQEPEGSLPVDVRLSDHGSLVLFRPVTQDGFEWLERNVGGEAQWFAQALVVEPRYANSLINGMVECGLAVRS